MVSIIRKVVLQMKVIGKTAKKVILWILAMFFFSGTLIYFPNFWCLFSLLAGLLFLPIEKWQNTISLFLKGKAKIVVTCIVAIVVLGTIPDSITTATPSEEASITATVETTFNASPEHTATPTTEPTSAPSPTATPLPTQKPTASPTPSPTTRPTATPAQRPTATPTPKAAQTYIINTKTGKFHKPSCSSVKNMSENNKREFKGNRDQLIQQNYDPCGICHP